MNEPETSVLLDRAADAVPVGPAPVTELLRAGRRARRRRAAGAKLAVAAGVVLVLGGSVTVVQLVGADEQSSELVADQGARDSADSSADQGATADSTPAPEQSGPIATGAVADCVEEYGAEAVRGRAFAFDGVVTAIGPPVGAGPEAEAMPDQVGVTFAVQEWFRGGSDATVTVDLPDPALVTSTGNVQGYGLGSRLLVSGEPRWGGAPLDAPVAWSCGFTRYYDEATAASWR